MSLSKSIFIRKQMQREIIQKRTGWGELNEMSVIFAMPHQFYTEVYLVDFWPDDNAGLWTANPQHATVVQLTETYKHLPEYLKDFRPRVLAKSARGLLTWTRSPLIKS